MTRPLIEVTDVGRVYPGPPEVHALRRANLTVSGGEMVAIVGPSGSGKSTLLNILGLLDGPTSGRLRLSGTDVADLTDAQRTALRATRIGFVVQAFHLVAHLDTVRNVMLPLVHQGVPARRRRELAERALRRVGLGHRLAARPPTLSGGEKQRVAVARAIVHSPQLILCDEPTGNLDHANTVAILDQLRELVDAETAVIVVTHEEEVRRAADRAVEVSDGRTR